MRLLLHYFNDSSERNGSLLELVAHMVELRVAAVNIGQQRNHILRIIGREFRAAVIAGAEFGAEDAEINVETKIFRAGFFDKFHIIVDHFRFEVSGSVNLRAHANVVFLSQRKRHLDKFATVANS